MNYRSSAFVYINASVFEDFVQLIHTFGMGQQQQLATRWPRGLWVIYKELTTNIDKAMCLPSW